MADAVEALRRPADKRQDQRALRGAVAGALMNTAGRDDALQTGFCVIKQGGDSGSINIPAGCKAGDWYAGN